MGIGLGYVNVVLLLPHILSTEQVGLYTILAAVANIAANFIKLGVPYIVIRYFPYFREHQEKQGSFFGFLIMLTLASFSGFVVIYQLLQPLIVWFYSDGSALFVDYNNLVLPFTFFMMTLELFHSYCRANFKSVAAGFAKDFLSRVVIFALLIGLYYGLISFEQFIWIYAFSYGIPTLFLLLYLAFNEMLVLPKSPFKHVNIKEMLMYGLFVSLGALSTVLINELDKVMIGGMTDLDRAGVYGISAFFGSVIIVPARSVLMIAAPVIAQLLKEDNLQKIEGIYKKSSINLLVVGLLLYVGVYINLHNIFKMLPSEYADGASVIMLIGLSKLFELASGANGEILLNSKYYKYDLLFNSSLVVLAVITNLLFIPMWGITGAALATALSLFLYNVAKCVFIYIKFQIQPFTVKTLLILAISAATLVVNFLLPVLDNFVVDLVVRSSIVTAVFATLVLALQVSPDLNEILANFIKKYRSR